MPKGSLLCLASTMSVGPWHDSIASKSHFRIPGIILMLQMIDTSKGETSVFSYVQTALLNPVLS